MKHHLKEKGPHLSSAHTPFLIGYAGMYSFMEEYTVSRKIPIPRLLYAFDVVLVHSWPYLPIT
jgi:hypothetical protein